MSSVKAKSYDIIRKPIITEKTTLLSANNQIVFEVLKTATKPEIKEAVSEVFGVKVKAVNVINYDGKKKVFRGKRGVRNAYKKAIVTLAEGEQIDISTGVK